MATTYNELRRLAHSRLMLMGVIVAFLVGPVLSASLFHGWGIVEMPEWLTDELKLLTQIGVGFAITAGAFTNGLGAQQEYWEAYKGKLLHLITIALALRGLGIAAIAMLLGYDQHVALLIGAGLTATDPAAIGIALELIRKPRNSYLLMLFWLYEIESVANDAFSAILDEGFSGAAFSTIAELLYWTVILGIGLAFAGEGARWLIRHDRLRNTIEMRYDELRKMYERQAQLEQVFILISVIVTMHLAFVLAASPIGVIGIGMIFGNAIYHRRRESDEEAIEDATVDEIRAHYHEIWTVAGLTIFLAAAITIMPFRALIAEPVHLRNGLFILVGGVLLMRGVYELYCLLRTKTLGKPFYGAFAVVSMLLASALLGVPTSTAAGMYDHGYFDASLDMFAAVLLSWLTVPISVVFIGRFSQQLNVWDDEVAEEAEMIEAIEEAGEAVPELVHR